MTAEMSNFTPNPAGGIPGDEGGNERRKLVQEATRWGLERNPTAGEAVLVAVMVCSGSPRSCFRAKSSQMSHGNEAEIKGPISRQRGAMMGPETGPKGSGRRLFGRRDESTLPQLGLVSVPRLLRALRVGAGGALAAGGEAQPPARE